MTHSRPEAHDALGRRFTALGCEPFRSSLLSEPLRGNYDYPLTTAYEFARAYCAKAGRTDQLERIAIGYYSNAGFQASAALRDRSHLIAVSAGMPVLLFAAFSDVFRSTNPLSVEHDSPYTEVLDPGDYRFPLPRQHRGSAARHSMARSLPCASPCRLRNLLLAFSRRPNSLTADNPSDRIPAVIEAL